MTLSFFKTHNWPALLAIVSDEVFSQVWPEIHIKHQQLKGVLFIWQQNNEALISLQAIFLKSR